MSEKEPFGYQKPNLSDQELAAKLDRVDELVSLMLDDELDSNRIGELEALLIDSPEARTQYIGMVQMHTDLVEYYNPRTTEQTSSPVLANLNQSVINVTPSVPPSPADSDIV